MPEAQRPRPPRRGAWPLLLAGLAAACGGAAPDQGEGAAGSAPPAAAHRNLDPAVPYVGARTCAGCHAEIAASYRETGMARSWSPLSPDTVLEDFTHYNEIEAPGTGVRYRMLERGGRYFARQMVLDGAGRELAADEREMLQVIGSGRQSRLYATQVQGRWYQMPVAWSTGRGGWDLAPGYDQRNLLFTREITGECTFCHNALAPPMPGVPNRFDAPFPTGIDCERCHGPGRLHVEKWLSPEMVPTAGRDDTIVNPRRLPRDLRLDVCAQCHLGGDPAAERLEREGRDLYAFRPGLPLLEVVVPLGDASPRLDRLGAAGQVDRLRESRCFQESGGRLECLTCHNPHVSIHRADRPADHFRRACLTCHQEAGCSGPEGARRATSPPDDCVACHMRRGEAAGHAHGTFTDHWIRRDIEARPAGERASFRLEPLLPGTGEALGPARLAHAIARAGLRRGLKAVEPGERDGWLQAAGAALDGARAGGLDSADLWFLQGTSLAAMGRPEKAMAALREAMQRDPAHRESGLALGAALREAGQPGEAAEIFRALLQRHPEDAGALAGLGGCALALGRPEEALGLLDRAVAGNPATAWVHASRAAALAGMGRPEEALEAARRAAGLDPQSPPIWELLADLLARSGRPEEAAAARAHAQRLATALAPAGSARMGAAP